MLSLVFNRNEPMINRNSPHRPCSRANPTEPPSPSSALPQLQLQLLVVTKFVPLAAPISSFYTDLVTSPSFPPSFQFSLLLHKPQHLTVPPSCPPPIAPPTPANHLLPPTIHTSFANTHHSPTHSFLSRNPTSPDLSHSLYDLQIPRSAYFGRETIYVDRHEVGARMDLLDGGLEEQGIDFNFSGNRERATHVNEQKRAPLQGNGECRPRVRRNAAMEPTRKMVHHVSANEIDSVRSRREVLFSLLIPSHGAQVSFRLGGQS